MNSPDSPHPANPEAESREGSAVTPAQFRDAILAKLVYAVGKGRRHALDHDWFVATALATRDQIVERWMEATRRTYRDGRKRVYYFSLEFLIGRLLLTDALGNLGLVATAREALAELGGGPGPAPQARTRRRARQRRPRTAGSVLHGEPVHPRDSALGVSWAVLASGMEVSRFGFLVGTLGAGIGFGLQNVVNNFVSGLILLYERPVQAGDIVEVGAVSGEVTRIGVRSSTVRTFPGAEVIVPNATLISADVTNWTLSDRRRRIDLPVGVAYGTPPERVIELLLGAVRGRPGVLASPAPVALFLRFGESALEFTLRFWTGDFDRWQALASELLVEVNASLGGAGIEIPFPQRDLHLRSVDPAAAESLAGRARGGAGGPDRRE